MCGIYGEIHFQGDLDVRAATARLQMLAHRGPDGWGVSAGNLQSGHIETLHNPRGMPTVNQVNLFLGHRRLSIIDLSDLALQPMQSCDGASIMVFNGEIYNSAELREQLVSRGHLFATEHSDTEALLNAYQEWGEGCLDRLNGMFAFAIYDRKRNRIFLARDRAGQKPLYYTLTDERFAFASELTPLTRLDEARVEVDPTSLAQYLLLGYVPDPRSIISGIHRLPPAHSATLDLSTRDFVTRCYWEPPLTPKTDFNQRRAEVAVDKHLQQAVRKQLVADVPIGAFISGGIDSTLIAKGMGSGDSALKMAMFAETKKTERKWVDRVANVYGLELSHVFLDSDIAEMHEEVLSRLDEPFDGSSAFSCHALYGIAEGRMKVFLTGDGGDELFSGYKKYETFTRIAWTLRILRAFAIALPLLRLVVPLFAGQKRYWWVRAFATGDALGTYAVRNSRPWLVGLLKNPPESCDRLFDYVDRHRDKLKGLDVKAAQYLDFRTILPGRMLYKADRLSMSWSFEARSPFMDHELIELAFSIPTRLHFSKGRGKTILRSLVARDLDRDFADRAKQGFGVPLKALFTGPQGKELLTGLADEQNLVYRFLDHSRTMRRYPQIRKGVVGEDEQELWRLVVLASYVNRHRDIIAQP